MEPTATHTSQGWASTWSPAISFLEFTCFCESRLPQFLWRQNPQNSLESAPVEANRCRGL